TPEPNEETDAAIWRQWQQCRVANLDSADALAAMMQVTQTLLPKVEGLSLTIVWKRIALCEQETSDRRAAHAR
ncbi:STY4526/YPO1902 family pathogenicity island replication protein, partial [Klebsiella pneumoniae]